MERPAPPDAPAAAASRWRRAAAPLGLALLFALLRGPTFLETLVHFDSEQAVAGNLPKDLIDGLVLPFFQYQYVPYAHGPLVMGLFLYPFFLALGKYYSVLVLFDFLVSLSIFLVWWAVARRAFGLRAGGPFALAFLVAPPLVVYMSTRGWANHWESLLFTGASFLALARAAEASARGRWTLLLGLLGGLGAFFNLQGLIAWAAAGVAWLLAAERSRARGLLRIGAGFAVGFAPSVALQLASGHRYAALLRPPEYQRHFDSASAKAAHFVTEILPALPGFPDRLPNLLYLATIAIAGIGVALAFLRHRDEPRARRAVVLTLLVFPPLWFAFYLAASFSLAPALYDLRYAVPLFPVFLAWAAGLGHRRGPWIAWAACAALALVALVEGSLASSIRTGSRLALAPDFGVTLRRFAGYNYRDVLFEKLPTLRGPEEEARVHRLAPPFASYGDEIRGEWAVPHVVAAVHERGAAGFDLRGEGAFFALGLGRAWMQAAFREPAAKAALRVFCENGSATPEEFWVGLGQALSRRLNNLQMHLENEARFRNEPLPPPSGAIDSNEARAAAAVFGECLARLPEAVHGPVAEGIGMDLYGSGDPDRVFAYMEAVFPDLAAHATAVLSGVGRGRARHELVTRNFVGPETWAPLARVPSCLAREGADPSAAVRGYEAEIERRGYRLFPVEGTEWKRIVFVGRGQKNE